MRGKKEGQWEKIKDGTYIFVGTPTITHRICCKCKIDKPITEFDKSRQNGQGYRYDCKQCCRAYHRTYYLKSVFGITQDEMAAAIQHQQGLCACCGEKTNDLAVDHNHISGMVRDLLCDRCNMSLGHIKEDLSTLEKIAAYLRKHQDGYINPIIGQKKITPKADASQKYWKAEKRRRKKHIKNHWNQTTPIVS